MDALPVATFLMAPEGGMLHLSRGWERLTGQSAASIYVDGYAVLIHPDDRKAAAERLRASLETGTRLRDEFRLRFGDGSYRTVVHEADAMREGSAITGWTGVVTDVHGLRQAEQGVARAISATVENARDARTRAHFVERLIEASDDCVKVLDLEGRLLSIAGRGREKLGILDFSTLAGADWASFWHGGYAGLARDAVATARAGGRGRFIGLRPVDDCEIWWDVTLTPIPGVDGRPEQLLCVSRDVTDMVRTNRALADSEASYRVLSDALPGLTFTATPDGRIQDVHGTLGPGDQYANDSRLGDGWLEQLHPDDRERVRTQWAASVATGNLYDTQFRTRVPDGSYRWQLVRALPQRNEAGTIVRWVGVDVDIEDQHRVDEQREQFVRLADASDDFIAIADKDGALTYANPAMRRALDITSDEQLAAARRLDFFLPQDRDFVKNHIQPAQMREGKWLGEFRFRNFRSNATIPVWYNTIALRDDAGQLAGFASVSRDLRERRRIEIGLRSLADAGSAMYGSLDLAGTFHNVATAVVRTFASWCSVEVPDADGSIRTVAVAHQDPARLSIIERVAAARLLTAEHPAERAIERGESTLIATLPPDWHQRIGGNATLGADLETLDTRSVVAVSIRSAQDGRVFGALTCGMDGDDPRGKFGAEDVRFAEEIAVRAALAFEHARAYERERRIAVTLQEASLPGTLPLVDNLHFAADYRPGKSEATIGGDWYDAFEIGDGRVAITIGDILGKGLAAAVAMGKVRQAMQSAAIVQPDLHAMLTVADRIVRAHSDETYATALAGIFDPARHEFSFLSAGHPGPILRRPDGTIEEFESHGVMLGLRPQHRQPVVTIATSPGATLAFFTDGLLEATHDMDEGLARVRAGMSSPRVAAAENPARALVDCVLGSDPAQDDIAVLFAHVGPSVHFERLRAMQLDGSNKRGAGRDRIFDVAGDALIEGTRELGGIVLTFPSNLGEIANARKAVRTLLSTTDATLAALRVVELAVGELVGNAVEHGSGTLIEMSFRLATQQAIIAVTNHSAQFARRPVDLANAPLAERGRGLAMLEALGCTVAIAFPSAGTCTVKATVPFIAAAQRLV